MELRLVAASFLLFGATLAAQTQDPDKPQNSPQAHLEELQREKERLQKEVGYVMERAAKQKQLLADKLKREKPQYKAIDAGRNLPAAPVASTPMQPPRMARVMTKDELANQPEGTAVVVNGRPIAQRAIDELVAYLATAPGGGEPEVQKQRAIFDLIRAEAIAASFDEVQAETEDRVGQILAELDAGKAPESFLQPGATGTVRGADPKGKVEVIHNGQFGPRFEQAAFTTAPGKRARPFRTAEGIAIVVANGVQKGERPELDRADVTVIQVAYTQDKDAMAKAQTAMNTGQVDVLARDEETYKLLPAMFKPAAVAVAPGAAPIDVEAVNKRLAEVGAQIAELQGKTDDDSKKKLRQLEQNYGELKALLRGAEDADQRPVEVDGNVDAKPTKPAPKKQ